jgi:hypothetical protein
MRSRFAVLVCVCALWSCDSSSNSSVSDRGPLVDNTQWVPSSSDEGEPFYGAPPEDAECALTPRDCPEYPWPDDECVEFESTSTCVASFVPECLDSFTVLSIYTRQMGDQANLCNWITLEQPSLRAIRAGDRVEVRAHHSPLTAPVPGEAHMTFVIADEAPLDHTVSIPSDFAFPSATWTATKDYPAGTPLLWHVDNHGSNEYMLIEVNVL